MSDLAALCLPAEWVEWNFGALLKRMRRLDSVFRTVDCKCGYNYYYSIAVGLLAEELTRIDIPGKTRFRLLESSPDRAALLKRALHDQHEWQVPTLGRILASEARGQIPDTCYDNSDDPPMIVAIKRSATMRALMAISKGSDISQSCVDTAASPEEVEGVLRMLATRMLESAWPNRPVPRTDALKLRLLRKAEKFAKKTVAVTPKKRGRPPVARAESR